MATVQSAAALEQASWAAWWQDDAHAVFAAREGAYRAYQQSGNAVAAARMATWLACDRLDFNAASSVAAGWLGRARRLLESQPTSPEHGWLAFHAGYLAEANGDSSRTVDLARQAAEIGRRLGVADLQMLGLALEGASLVACAHVAEGMRCLDEATATALETDASVPIANAWTFCFLVSACVSVRDYRRAFEWCDRISEFARRFNSRYMLGFCRAYYGAVHICRGEWTEAEGMLEAAVEDLSRSRPPYAVDALVWLAELRRRQGRADDAAQLLDRAGDWSRPRLCRALLALDAGEALRAAELAERCLRQTPTQRTFERIPALEILARARIARGQLEAAHAAVASLRALEDSIGTPLLHASADLVEGALAAASGDHQRAQPLLEDAVDEFERCGTPFEAAQARIELATTMLALGRSDVAAQEAQHALERLQALGAATLAERARRMLNACTRSEESRRVGGVTGREGQVLHLLAEGLTNRQIGERLELSEHTVHRHVTSILRKLDLPSRTAAAAHGVRAGLANGRDR